MERLFGHPWTSKMNVTFKGEALRDSAMSETLEAGMWACERSLEVLKARSYNLTV